MTLFPHHSLFPLLCSLSSSVPLTQILQQMQQSPFIHMHMPPTIPLLPTHTTHKLLPCLEEARRQLGQAESLTAIDNYADCL